MSKHNILTTHAYAVADMDQSMMSVDDESDPRTDRSTGRVSAFSLFRAGQIAHRPPVTLDHAQTGALVTPPLMPPINHDRVWESLTEVSLNAESLARNSLFTEQHQSPVTAHFDILRTRMLQALEERKWRRVAITSPTHGCGKSFVAINLALSMARLPSRRAALIDMELRDPNLARMLGVQAGPLQEFLTGEQPLEAQFRRFGSNLALGLNGVAVPNASAVLHETATAVALTAMLEQLEPDLAIFDMPPALGNDDVIAMLPHIDAVLIVTDGTKTSPNDIRACERLFEGKAPLLGVVLNRAQDRHGDRYRYGKS